MTVNVIGMDDGYDHAVCYFCGWHSVGFKVGHPQHGDLAKWARMHEEDCRARLHAVYQTDRPRNIKEAKE